ncbi:hypothetical protein CR205_04510 [Alteribacter lacisalsi]|uniref:Uncharacterized protein n=1 Tax=Alteribacter lacisalsi TaxID=2045244 RepID=A0A2W0HAD5_9BACI|nr:hypothetical protein CR205_04510 [Alteribacter lacisalsi]
MPAPPREASGWLAVEILLTDGIIILKNCISEYTFCQKMFVMPSCTPGASGTPETLGTVTPALRKAGDGMQQSFAKLTDGYTHLKLSVRRIRKERRFMVWKRV